jgi:hypothetical protein
MVEGKKEMLCFLVRLSIFNIRDAPAFMTKGRHMFVWHISDYARKGRHALLGAHLLLATKAGMSPFPRKGRRALEWHISVLFPPYNAWSHLGQNNGGARSCHILTISFHFWMHPSKNLVVTKYNSCKGWSSPPPTLFVFAIYQFLSIIGI